MTAHLLDLRHEHRFLGCLGARQPESECSSTGQAKAPSGARMKKKEAG